MDPIKSLRTQPSMGRRVPEVLKNSAGEITVFDPDSTPCPGCGQVTMPSEEITKVYHVWWHASCARGWLDDAGVDEAWKVIARQMANHPSHFRATEIRTVITQLLRMVGSE